MSIPAVNLDSNQTTEGNRPPEGATITVQPAPSLGRVQHDHHQPRFFLGPMPTSVASQDHSPHDHTEAHDGMGVGKRLGFPGIRNKFMHATKHRRSMSSEESVSRERAFMFFVREGGRPEEFESQERGVKEEILRRVRRTRWFPDDKRNNASAGGASSNWVGDTFEIGKDLLGLSTLATNEEEPAVIGRSSLSKASSPNPSYNSPEVGAKSLSKLAGTSTTASGLAEPGTPPLGPKAPINTSSLYSVDRSHISNNPGTKGSQNDSAAAASTSTSSYSTAEPGSSRTRLLTPPAAISLGPSSISAAHSDTQVPASTTTRPSLPDAATTAPAASGLRSALRSDNRKDTGKVHAKVTFPETTETAQSESPASEQPVAPIEVLTRKATITTSAGAAARINDEMEPEDGTDVVIRDRMLIRVLFTPSAVPKYLDEKQLLEMPEARKDRATMWREYLVVWKLSFIELYEPYTMPGKEWITKHKHLAFRIPLQQFKTKISVFSNVDMSFCITCPKQSAHSHLPSHLMSKEDKLTTLIFIMKTKSRSRSVDWIWRLWRTLGGEVPDFIEIRCPAIDARVNFPIPAIDLTTGLEGYKTFTRESVIQNCRDQMSGVPEWDLLIESALKTVAEGEEAEGEEGRLELCWRTESKLDWVWLDDDANGEPRPWSVLFGAALMNPRFSSDLELRVAEHFPTRIALGNDTVLHEPSAIEGYLYRYKTTTHLRDPTYLATHNGNIFFINPTSAHPPQPPTAALQEEIGPEGELDPAVTAASVSAGAGASGANHPPMPRPSITRASEVQRGAAQILNAKMFLDMRNIVAVNRLTEALVPAKDSAALKPGRGRVLSTTSRERRTSTTTNASSIATHTHENTGNSVGDSGVRGTPPVNEDGEEDHLDNLDDIVLDEEDLSDEGGDEVLDNLVADSRTRLKTKRSFEIVTRNHETIRFEAYSCKVSVEWIKRIRALVSYWTRKQRVDARLEMDIVHAMAGRTRYLVPRAGDNVYPAPPPDPRDASPLLGRWWHWCVLNGCRSIVRAGRLFVRSSTRGEMRHYYFVLVQGHLIRFKLTSSRSQPASILHSHAKTINLLDAYVTSGYFAALELDDGNKIFEPTARRFQDGLETDDADMDTLIVIRYRSMPVDHSLQHHARSSGASEAHTIHGATTEKTAIPHTEEARSSVPTLNGKHSMLVLRARSRLERDAWCWALNAEIERLVRVNALREQAIRNDGGIQS